ncbi:MAG: YciI family protein [Burkholderiales bacterium]
MLFHVRMTDYPISRRTPELRDQHWKYLDEHAAHFIARGPTRTDDGKTMLSSIFYLDFPDRPSVEDFIANEPNNKAGVHQEVEIFGWGNPLNRRQRDFPVKEGTIYWYVRGYAKPGAYLQRKELFEAHQAYFKPYDAEHFFIRGGVTSNDGTWVGSANIVAMPDRDSIDRLVAQEPFCRNGLFERVVVERFTFGGRSGPSA